MSDKLLSLLWTSKKFNKISLRARKMINTREQGPVPPPPLVQLGLTKVYPFICATYVLPYWHYQLTYPTSQNCLRSLQNFQAFAISWKWISKVRGIYFLCLILDMEKCFRKKLLEYVTKVYRSLPHETMKQHESNQHKFTIYLQRKQNLIEEARKSFKIF